jgi:hypothetical protein
MIVPVARKPRAGAENPGRAHPNPSVYQRFICLKLVNKPLGKMPVSLKKTVRKGLYRQIIDMKRFFIAKGRRLC